MIYQQSRTNGTTDDRDERFPGRSPTRASLVPGPNARVPSDEAGRVAKGHLTGNELYGTPILTSFRSLTLSSDKSVVITPHVFLPWLRKRLERSGVKFFRKSLTSLADLKGSGYDVLINATALGARYLADVADEHMVQVRGQTVLAKTTYNKIFMRHGKDYTYVIPRLDGTAVLGGIKQYGNASTEIDESITEDVCFSCVRAYAFG